jgi:cytochrome c553
MKHLLLLALAGCTASAVADPTGSDSPTRRFEHDMMVRFHMHESYGLVRGIERLLLRGKLAEAKDLARAISTAPDEPGMGAWAPLAARVRDQAGVLAAAKTIDAACAAEGVLGRECAACHAASGASPEFSSPPRPPADKPTIEARMARHLWAADRLWEGLVGGADDAWGQGLDVLAATPLPAAQLGATREPLAKKLQGIAAGARKGTADHAAVYGDLLATCAGCHTTP